MVDTLYATVQERAYLRELASKCMEYAALPVMAERTRLWYRHNALQGERPMVVMEMGTFEGDMLPPLRCQSKAAQAMERELLRHTVNHELIDDDKVIPPYFGVGYQIHLQPFGIEIARDTSQDSAGRAIGYKDHHPITDLPRDLPRLGPSKYYVDRESTRAQMEFAGDILEGVMPVRLINESLVWYPMITHKVIPLMGLEALMLAMMDEPEAVHALMRFVTEDIMAFVHWQQREGLLMLNNANHYVGSGSYGFTHELPTEACKETGVVTPRDLWVNLNSQESVGISPQAFGEFVYPYNQQIAEAFGLAYFGCCEPVHQIWSNWVSKLARLRKVSISPWCDEAFMGEALAGSGVIYSRKPSPNYVGVGSALDEEGLAAHIGQTLQAARGCGLEIIFRDVYSLEGDRSKPGRAVAICRRLIDEM
ncbi:MAG: uroporphyrinogen decarboxylase/cobalamine-independent methonine synthase family protein [Anaerolineae bacterium]